MANLIKIITFPFRAIKYFFNEFIAIYHEVFTNRYHFFSFLKIQIYILFAVLTIGFFATSLGNIKAIFFVYFIGLGIIFGFFAFFFLHLLSEKGVDILWGFSGEPGVDELASPYFDKADFALREERYENAILLLEKVLELNPKNLKALMKIAQINHHNLENYSKALTLYKKILNIIGWDEQENFYYIEAKKGISEIIKMLNA